MKNIIIFFSFSLLICNIYSQNFYGPYGGGRNYELMLNSFDLTINSSDFNTIKNGIENATSGQVILININDNEIISLDSTVTIPNGVTIFGMRGIEGKKGARFTVSESNINKTGFILKDGSRLSGVRLKGLILNPESHVSDGASKNIGVKINNANNIFIDNCEISHWTIGISVDNIDLAKNINIHNNFIHRNMTNGLGYGIYVGDNTYLNIYKNIFDYNRHSVAGGGFPNSGYNILRNLFLTNRTSQNMHEIDMHGCRKSSICQERYQDCFAAGGIIEIAFNHFATDIAHHNSISNRYPNISIAGEPENATIHNNHFTRKFATANNAAEYQFLYQRHAAPEADQRCIDLGLADEEEIFVIQNDDNGRGITLSENNFEQNDMKLMYISWGGITKWNILKPYMNELFLIGDFNGDGKSDFFKGNGSSWWISWGGISEWIKLGNSHKTTSSLFVKDWNRDGIDDLVYKSGDTYTISYFNSNGNFYTGIDNNNTGNIINPDFQIMDFDGDTIPDYFETTGTEWYITYSSTGVRTRINGSSKLKEQLMFGDLDGDGKTDIINIGDPPKYVGDFNEDGQSDALSNKNNASKFFLNKNMEGNSDSIQISEMYPNPVKDILFLNIENGFKSAEIYNIQGKIIKNIESNKNQKQLNVSWLQKGVYFIKIKANNGEFTKKIIKN
ncbi:T9SS type A sorting domain-containing protein [Aquimarina sp. AU474]|uniref:T9SS type A sorting domain-containing protein n=1 Tax=Aquimarina sp. AU474 TaxID=2108529 RepID=UPI000D68C49F|nr:T9SS type A sorting domain-containing protein [Aquimarina sp. AU474]